MSEMKVQVSAVLEVRISFPMKFDETISLHEMERAGKEAAERQALSVIGLKGDDAFAQMLRMTTFEVKVNR